MRKVLCALMATDLSDAKPEKERAKVFYYYYYDFAGMTGGGNFKLATLLNERV